MKINFIMETVLRDKMSPQDFCGNKFLPSCDGKCQDKDITDKGFVNSSPCTEDDTTLSEYTVNDILIENELSSLSVQTKLIHVKYNNNDATMEKNDRLIQDMCKVDETKDEHEKLYACDDARFVEEYESAKTNGRLKTDSTICDQIDTTQDTYDNCHSVGMEYTMTDKQNTNDNNQPYSFLKMPDDDSLEIYQELPTENTSGEMHNQSCGGSIAYENEIPKRKLSFRALVRMKGLGKKLRRKSHEPPKVKEAATKHNTRRAHSVSFSETSSKYLHPGEQHSRLLISENVERNKKSHSFSQPAPKHSLQGESSSSESSDICDVVCSEEYLKKRRFAVCEEIEKDCDCGDQTLAEVRSILVIQHKLTGFGLL